MADTKITGLAALATAAYEDVLAVIDDPSGTPLSKKVTLTTIRTLLQSEDWRWAGDLSPAQITAAQNNYNPTSLSTALVLRLTTDASRNITGLAGGADGRLILIFNVGSFNVVLTDEDAASTAGNRFALIGDLTLRADEAALLWYDSTTSRWRALRASIATADLQNDAVTYAKMQDVSATQRALGRNTAGAGDVEEVTASQIVDWVGSTRGSILYRGAAGWAALTPGTSGQFLQSQGAGADPAYAAAAAALTREGGQTTEGTTTSTSEVDLITAASLTIDAQRAMATFLARKSTGAADTVSAGLKINTTVVRAAVAISGSTNEAQSGLINAWFSANIASYLGGLRFTVSGRGATDNWNVTQIANADFPAAAITDIVTRALVANALITEGHDEMHVYSFAAS